MTGVEQLEQAILKLDHHDQEALRDWLGNLLEDDLVMTDAFKEEIAAGKANMTEGRVRVHQP